MKLEIEFSNNLKENISIHNKLFDYSKDIIHVIKNIQIRLKKGGKLLFCGNGGSEADGAAAGQPGRCRAGGLRAAWRGHRCGAPPVEIPSAGAAADQPDGRPVSPRPVARTGPRPVL